MPRKKTSSNLKRFILFLEASECPIIRPGEGNGVTVLCSEEDIIECFVEWFDDVKSTRHKIPRNLRFESGQAFFNLDGTIEEVRLTGKYVRGGSRKTVEWSTTVRPNVTRWDITAQPRDVIPQGNLALNPLDERRLNIAALRVPEELLSLAQKDEAKQDDSRKSSIWVSFRERPRLEPDMFPSQFAEEKLLRIPASPVYVLLHQAIASMSKPGAWTAFTEESWFKFHELPHHPFSARAFFYPAGCDAQEMQRRFAHVRPDLLADIVDIFYAHWFANGRPEWTKITIEQILKYRGLPITKAALEKHIEAVRDAQALQLNFGSLTERGNKIIRLHKSTEPQTTPVSSSLLQQARGQQYIYCVGVYFRREIGPTTYFTAAGEGLTLYNPKMGILFDQEVLTWHEVTEAYAKRLMRYLRAEWRCNPKEYEKQGRYRAWEKHLTDAGIFFPSTPAKQKKFMFHLLLAVKTLCIKGLLEGNPHISSACYEDKINFRPMEEISLPELLKLRVALLPPMGSLTYVTKYLANNET